MVVRRWNLALIACGVALWGVAATPAQGEEAGGPAAVHMATADCSDSGPGTAAEPVCTLQAALEKADGRVLVRGGTYRQQIVNDVNPQSTVWVEPYPGEEPRLGDVRMYDTSRIGFRRLELGYNFVRRAHHISYEDNLVTGENGLWSLNAAHLRYVGNLFRDTNEGIVNDKSTDIEILDNEFTRIPRAGRTINGDGIQPGKVARIRIVGNDFHDFPNIPHNDGIEVSYPNTDIDIRENTFRKVRPIIIIPGHHSSTYVNSRIVIADNLVTDTAGWCLQTINVQHAFVLHNTCLGLRKGLRFHGAKAKNNYVANNVTAAIELGRATMATEESNWVGVKYVARRVVTKYGPGTVSKPAPQFNSDWTLAPGSVGEGAGIAVKLPASVFRPSGTAADELTADFWEGVDDVRAGRDWGIRGSGD